MSGSSHYNVGVYGNSLLHNIIIIYKQLMIKDLILNFYFYFLLRD